MQLALHPRISYCSLEDSLRSESRRREYAQNLNLAFHHQLSSSGQAAAVLSLQVLLSLDPHGARVQPKPELLFYTPAGFHAAVCKTLMQAVVVPQHESNADARYAGKLAALLLAAREESAAVAGGTQQQQQQQQQQEQGDPNQVSYTNEQNPHYLQAWSEVLFPAWYVWWHIGLLAYHQQQQQQQQHNTGNSAAAAVGCRAGSSGGGDGGGSATAVQAQELYNSPDARYASKLACVDTDIASNRVLLATENDHRIFALALLCPCPHCCCPRLFAVATNAARSALTAKYRSRCAVFLLTVSCLPFL
jgi:hypothetical protein